MDHGVVGCARRVGLSGLRVPTAPQAPSFSLALSQGCWRVPTGQRVVLHYADADAGAPLSLPRTAELKAFCFILYCTRGSVCPWHGRKHDDTTGGAAPSAQSIGGMSAMVGKGARQGLIAGEISCLLVIGLTTFSRAENRLHTLGHADSIVSC